MSELLFAVEGADGSRHDHASENGHCDHCGRVSVRDCHGHGNVNDHVTRGLVSVNEHHGHASENALQLDE